MPGGRTGNDLCPNKIANDPLNLPDSKDIAWNGIQFSYPAAWQIAAVGASHLMMEGPSGPTLEIIWSRIKGRFSHAKHLKRLAAHFPNKSPVSFKSWALPPDWQDAVSQFDASGFQWSAGAENGQGVMLYCATCRRACLVHFLQHHFSPGQSTLLAILNSFRDHYAEGGQIWNFFNIRATLPVPFELDRYRLDAGRFELVFGHRQNQIILHRWALAEIALKNKGLAEFGREMGLIDPQAAQASRVSDFSGMEERREASGADAWMRWLTARPCHYWCRLWHVESCNRILGVVAQTRRPMNTELFERICTHYETF